MNPVQLIFEHGVSVYLNQKGRWVISNTSDGKFVFVNPNNIQQEFDIRPILITYEYTHGKKIDLLMPKHITGRLLDIDVSEFMQSDLMKAKDHLKVMNIGYTTGAVIYHCKRLTHSYRKICDDFVGNKIPLINQQEKQIFSSQEEPYYEFDALITAARRAYDITRYILWKYFGPKNGSVPASFKKCLPLCHSLPVNLKERLESSWSRYGLKLTKYRDCVQHYSPIDFILSSAHMTRLKKMVWSTSLIIADNPEAKSKRGFTYNDKIDALSYAWEITTEILDIAKLIIKEASEKVKA